MGIDIPISECRRLITSAIISTQRPHRSSRNDNKSIPSEELPIKISRRIVLLAVAKVLQEQSDKAEKVLNNNALNNNPIFEQTKLENKNKEDEKVEEAKGEEEEEKEKVVEVV